MSQEQANAFLDRLNDDEVLAEQADDAFVRALMSVASRAGYEISEDELREALDADAGRVSDEELGAIAGGVGSPPTVASGTAGFSRKGFNWRR